MSITFVPSVAPVPHPALERARLHRRLGDLVERLIAVMDDLSADPDLEDGADDEPSLSASIPTLSWEGSQDAWLQGRDDDQEWQCEDEGAEHDGREPEDYY